MFNEVTIQGEIISITDNVDSTDGMPYIALMVECKRDVEQANGSHNVDVFKARAYGVKAREIRARVVCGEIIIVSGALRSLYGPMLDGVRHMYAEIEIRRYYTASGRG